MRSCCSEYRIVVWMLLMLYKVLSGRVGTGISVAVCAAMRACVIGTDIFRSDAAAQCALAFVCPWDGNKRLQFRLQTAY